MTPEHVLSPQQAELKHLGFKLLQVEPGLLIAGRHSFYWDCLFSFINYTVFVRRVTTLSVEMLERDRQQFLQDAKRLNPPVLPRGVQSGNAVLVVYIADQVEVAAQAVCETTGKLAMAQFYVPAALDLSLQTVCLFKTAPLWGRIYYGKFRYILSRVLSPKNQPSREPLSTVGVISTLMISIPFLVLCLAFLLLMLR